MDYFLTLSATQQIDPHSNDKNYSGRYLRFAGWIGLLLTGYIFNRALSFLSIPCMLNLVYHRPASLADAQHHTWLGHFRNMTDLIFLGFIQAWFVELLDKQSRWMYINQSLWFYPLFFLSGLSFSLITSIPGFDESISEGTTIRSSLFLFVLTFVFIAIATILVWHILHAKRVLRTSKDFIAFVSFRIINLSVLSISYYLIHTETNLNGFAKLHLHHYFVAWMCSLVAAFNHKISIAFLAITSGIFVQGIAAYSAASMFYRGNTDIPCPEVSLRFS